MSWQFLIDRYDEIPVKKNETALLKLILKQITKALRFSYSNKKHKKKLTPIQLEKLALIRMFFVSLSAKEHLEIYNNVHNY